MLLKEVCTQEVVCCGAQTRVLQAAELMRHKHVGAVVVVGDSQDDRIPIGIVTDRDLVVDVLGNGLDPATTTLGSLMHRPLVIANEDEDAMILIGRMREHGVRRVPVVDRQGAVAGIITLSDLLKVLVDETDALLQIMTRSQNHERRSRR